MKVLVVAAHPDDEAFGCLGTLLQHKKAGDSIYIQWFTQGRDEAQSKGGQALAKFLGAKSNNCLLDDQLLDQVAFKNLITAIEKARDFVKPDIVYTNFIGDLNKDHRLVAEATMVACRPYSKNAPETTVMYEIEGTTDLGTKPFSPTHIYDVDAKEKRKLIKKYYPTELINGRYDIKNYERFEIWPPIKHS